MSNLHATHKHHTNTFFALSPPKPNLTTNQTLELPMLTSLINCEPFQFYFWVTIMNWHCFWFNSRFVASQKLFLNHSICVFIRNSNPIRFIGIFIFIFIHFAQQVVCVTNWIFLKKIQPFFVQILCIYRNCYRLIYHFIYILRVLVIHSVNYS